MKVHARSKQHINTVFQHLITHSSGHGFHQVNIPRTGHQRAGGESRAIKGLVSAFARRVDTESRGTVAERRHGDAQAGDGTGIARHIRDVGSHPCSANQEGHFLFQGQCLKDFFDIVGTKHECASVSLRKGSPATGKAKQNGKEQSFHGISI